MKRIIKAILKLFIPSHLQVKIRALLDLPEQLNELKALQNVTQQINELKNQNNSLIYELSKIKTILLLKEQSPELLHSFGKGLINNEDLINSITKSYIFNDLRNDFTNNMSSFISKFIGGAPELSLNDIYKNQLNIAKNPLYNWLAFSGILHVFMPHYENDEIAKNLDDLYNYSFLDNDSWGTQQYISWLLLRKEEAKALEILKIYLKKYDLDTIAGMIPVADLANRNGITNEAISESSQLFQTITNNVENKVLENYIEKFGKDATIAIVGNGPHELGLGKGEEIDTHDIVIRFNGYNDTEEYFKDYGKKINIVIFTSNVENINYEDLLNRFKIDLFATHSLYEEPFCNRMRQYYKKNKIKNISTIGLSATRKEIQEKYGINWPTSGFRGIYYLKKILKKNIKRIDIYGFALKHGMVIGGHYENTNFADINVLKNKNHHDLWMEYNAMLDMFND